MQIRTAVEADRSTLAALAGRQQRRPERHITYLGVEPEHIAAEMVEEDDDWTAVSAVAEHDGRIRGWLMGSVDAEMGRVWWFGPFIDAQHDGADDRADDGADGGVDVGAHHVWRGIADALYAHASSLLPDTVDQEELAPDARHVLLADWALDHGFHRDPGSAILGLPRAIAAPTVPDAGIVRPATAQDGRLVELHDELFAGTHTTGQRLLAGADAEHIRLVLEVDHTVVGYVAVEVQPDGGGYIDYLGVDPAHRRRGFGLTLVRAGVGALADRGCERFDLTVREANHGARKLYAALGFVEERVIHPYRKGFELP
jgi:ribosomal protein S18 acetylase RimI-like enzyme